MYQKKIFAYLKSVTANVDWLQRIRNFSLLTGESAVDLGVNLIVMIMIERSLGGEGLGIFAFMLSILVFVGFASDFGLSRYLEFKVAVDERKRAREEVIENVYCSLSCTSFLCVVFLLVAALTHVHVTRVDEHAVGYFIIGLTVFLNNLNHIRIAILQGRGKFETASSLRIWKRVYLLVAVYFMSMWEFPPSLMMLGYLASELGMLKKSAQSVKLPGVRKILAQRKKVVQTLQQSREFLLTDEALDVVLYLDFFILGYFVSSASLGMYAEASVLARIFLLMPSSIKPVFRRYYFRLVNADQVPSVFLSACSAAKLIFFLHSVLALYVLLYYSAVMESLYHVQGGNMVPFYIFVEILPGLLFFSAVTSQEPVYEVDGKEVLLQKTVIVVAFLNLVLNCFFIPFAGFYGAAFATSCSMFVYFFLFGRGLASQFHLPKIKFVIAGFAIYLIYMLFHSLELPFSVAFFLVPSGLFILLYGINFFTDESGFSETESTFALPERQ